MADNTVSVKITGEDDLGPAFASATAQEKAFSRAMDETARKEIASSRLVSEAEGRHLQTLKLLSDAEKTLADGEKVLADRAAAVARQHSFLATVTGALAKALDGGTGNGGIVGGLLGSSGAAEKAGTALGTVGTIIVPLIGLVATLGIALTPFVASLALVTAGVAGFAALAVPEISKVIQARQALSAAEQKYDLAKTPAQRAAALAAEKAATAGLTAQQKEMMKPLGELSGMFSRLQKAIQPEVMRAFGEGLKIIKDLMPAFKPLVEAAGKAIDGFLRHIDTWLGSSSGQKFIHWLEFEGPRAMAVFGHDLWDITKVVGRVFDFMYNEGQTMDHRWRIFWHAMAQVVDGFRIGFTQMGDLVRKDLEVIWHAVTVFASNFVRGFQQMGHLVASSFESMINFLDAKWAATKAWARAIPGQFTSFFAALPGEMAQIGVNIMEGLLHGLESAFGPVLSWAERAASDLSGVWSKVLGIFSPSRVFYQHGRNMMLGLQYGIRDGQAAVRSQLAGFGGSLTPGHAGAGGFGGQVVLQPMPGGSGLDQLFFTWLANGIRARGGDPRILTQKVSALT